jgi:hypothetical protein
MMKREGRRCRREKTIKPSSYMYSSKYWPLTYGMLVMCEMLQIFGKGGQSNERITDNPTDLNQG